MTLRRHIPAVAVLAVASGLAFGAAAFTFSDSTSFSGSNFFFFFKLETLRGTVSPN